ncbi:MAG: hypothetical protein CL760_04995 [Chloroflexi bacterium]|nr:hypothetical protein [Chloroflexota bacterium]|tara:strand:+ start:5984 stop:6583 length:600 start_codon:yes stop_codon:yes gene_type:complete
MDLSKVPIPKSGKKLDNIWADKISKYWVEQNNSSIKRFIAGGEWGQAYEIEDNKVLKVTVGIEEAAYAYEAMKDKPFGYVPIHEVLRVNESVFIIIMDLIEQPEYLMNITKELDDILDSKSLSINSDPKSVEDLIQNDFMIEILFDLHDIVVSNDKFPMGDVHCENIGFKLGTTELVVIDQMFDFVDEKYYQKEIEQME